MKEKANRDYTYCYGMNCKRVDKCLRYVGNYEFTDTYYSFLPGNVGEWKCIEEGDKNE